VDGGGDGRGESLGARTRHGSRLSASVPPAACR
jgi:hypothetical protein